MATKVRSHSEAAIGKAYVSYRRLLFANEQKSTQAEPMPDVPYTHGHHDSVLRSHRWRTADNSAAYLLPHLHPGLDLLDVGCGPGTITVDLAARVAPGSVMGVDASSEVIAQAEAHAAQRDAANVR